MESLGFFLVIVGHFLTRFRIGNCVEPNPYRTIIHKLALCGRAKRWLVIPSFWLLVGCASSASVANPDPPCPVFKNSDSISMAVLPFMDKTGTRDLEKIVRKAVYSHLSVRRYRDIELHVVDRILESHGLSDPGVLYNRPIKELGRLLNSDALISGEITTYQKLFLGVYSQMAVGATITIWDTRSGQIVWSDQHIARIHDGGVPFSLMELPFISFRSGYNLRDRVKMRTVDELSRHLTSRIPKSASPLYTGGITDNCRQNGTGTADSDITTHQQALSKELDRQNLSISPLF